MKAEHAVFAQRLADAVPLVGALDEELPSSFGRDVVQSGYRIYPAARPFQ